MTMTKRKYDSSIHDAPVRGMANMLWWLAWADAAEERGVNLSGKSVERMAPPTPAKAFMLAERYLGMIEQANNTSWEVCFFKAWVADHLRDREQNKDVADFVPGQMEPSGEDYGGEFAEEFGQFLAYMLIGSGQDWFDDHAEFTLNGGREFEVPHLDSGEFAMVVEDEIRASFRAKAV
jgi:hypothetical protein